MEIILLENVTNIGSKGDVLRVRDGYARNFLLPKKLAMAATRANQEFVEQQRSRAEKRKAKEKAEAIEQAKKLNEVKVKIEAKAGDQGKLFGAVTPEMISDALQQQGYSFTKKQIHIKDPIRSIGTRAVTVEIYPEVKATIAVEVVAQP